MHGRGFRFRGIAGDHVAGCAQETVRRLVGVYGEGAEGIVTETADGFTRRV